MVKTKMKVLLYVAITGFILSLLGAVLFAGMLISENMGSASNATKSQVKGQVASPPQYIVNSTALPAIVYPRRKTSNTVATNGSSVTNSNVLTLQVGSYLSLNSAEKEAARVAGLGFKAEVHIQEKSPPVYVVWTGNFTDMATASAEAKRLQQQGKIAASIVPIDKAALVPGKAGIPLWLAQVGSFLTQRSAGTEVAKLKNEGIKASVVPLYDKKSRLWYAVILGTFPDKAKAKEACAAFKGKVNGECIVYPIDKGIFEGRMGGKESMNES
ncbi:SPOR domain-containing protein [Maridesulfovibrio zosterae]|uniref:SPOR domain-containing protein n=1 Tax=Maridesulfovibrio zosterae TaxID=82171 RepID=UPI00042A0AD9|nr:SPOR domain-containing protein [Maridesulfovibrio zosterae]